MFELGPSLLTPKTNIGSKPRDYALRFLVHFMGDLHMPLHLTGRDRGGNEGMSYDLPKQIALIGEFLDRVRFDGRITSKSSPPWPCLESDVNLRLALPLGRPSDRPEDSYTPKLHHATSHITYAFYAPFGHCS